MNDRAVHPPKVQCRLGGVPLPADVLGGLTSVVVEQQTGHPAQLRLRVVGSAVPELVRLARRQVPLDVRVDGHRIDLFSGEVVGVEERWGRHGERTVVVRAADALHSLRLGRRCRAFLDSSAIEIAEELVGDVGLDLQADRTVPSHRSVHQTGETDLAFLRRLLAAHGLSMTLRGDTVHVRDRSGLGSTMHLRPGEELIELALDRRVGEARDSAIGGWHAGRAAAVGSGADDQLAGWTIDDDFASELASAVTARTRTLSTVARGIALGDTAIRPGTPIDVRGRGPAAVIGDGDDLVVETAVHRLDANEGYVTEFSTEATDDEPAVAPATLTLGLVTDLDDPEGTGRIQVELPAYDGLETSWMPVVCDGAGDGVGIVALPDVGATVAVLGPIDQPSNGVVLGGLFGETTPPGEPVVDGRSRRFAARLPDGTQVLLDGDRSQVLVENGDGSRIEMTPDAMTLHAAVDLEIAAPGRHLLIRADKIDFERG